MLLLFELYEKYLKRNMKFKGYADDDFRSRVLMFERKKYSRYSLFTCTGRFFDSAV